MNERTIRVLLVDDEDELIDYMSKRLLLEGFTVKASKTGSRALLLATDEKFDVAVVDLKMPGIDGIETIARLHDLQPFLQSIILTGHGSLDAALESGKQGVFVFLEKPVDHDVLVSAIHDAATRKRALVQDAFDTEMRRITTSGGSPREILHALEKLREKFGRH